MDVVSAGVDDHIATDIHLTEPTEGNYIHPSHIASAELNKNTHYLNQ